MGKKRKQNLRSVQYLQYLGVRTALLIARLLPISVLYAAARMLGTMLYWFGARRRDIAATNIRKACHGELDETSLQALVHRSFTAFFYTAVEAAKLQLLLTDAADLADPRIYPESLRTLFTKAHKIHIESRGCIFLTPHLGNWELLPYVSAKVGIPLAVVVRPLDNPYLERLLYARRAVNGQIVIPKRNAFFTLQKLLQEGKSIGMLPDQSTKKGILVDFMGRPAMTTPVPAILALSYQRPVVVVACCRSNNQSLSFEGFVSDPIWPAQNYSSEKAEIIRITEAIHKEMETVIRRYPEQYLWMHNRWKVYRTKKQFLD
jgi:Kdo2-lipid IVA lauroyltransferase/acyltransferase